MAAPLRLPAPRTLAPPRPPRATRAVGQEAAAEFDFFLGSGWVWGSVGVSWGALLLFTAAGALALRWTNPASPRPTGARAGLWGAALRARAAPGGRALGAPRGTRVGQAPARCPNQNPALSTHPCLRAALHHPRLHPPCSV